MGGFLGSVWNKITGQGGRPGLLQEGVQANQNPNGAMGQLTNNGGLLGFLGQAFNTQGAQNQAQTVQNELQNKIQSGNVQPGFYAGGPNSAASSYFGTQPTAQTTPDPSGNTQTSANPQNPYGFKKNPDGTVTDSSGKIFGTPNATQPSTGAQTTNGTAGGGATGNPNGVNTVPPTNTKTYVDNNPPGNPSANEPNPFVPGVNYNDPNSRASQINALTQNLGLYGAQGSQGDAQEQALENQIQQAQTGIGKAQGNIFSTPEGVSLQTGQNAALLAQQTPLLQSLTNQLAQYQANRQQSIGAEGSALGGAENNVPATQVLNPAQTLVSPFGGSQVAGSGNNFSGGEALGSVAAGEAQIPLQQAVAAGGGAAANINSYLQQNPGLNPSNLTAMNGLIQWMNGQTGNPQYQTLGNYLTSYATQMAPVLAPGGSVTDASRALQQSLINGQASGKSISEVLAQLNAEAQATLANRASGGQGGGTVAGGANVTAPTGGTTPGGTLFNW